MKERLYILSDINSRGEGSRLIPASGDRSRQGRAFSPYILSDIILNERSQVLLHLGSVDCGLKRRTLALPSYVLSDIERGKKWLRAFAGNIGIEKVSIEIVQVFGIVSNAYTKSLRKSKGFAKLYTQKTKFLDLAAPALKIFFQKKNVGLPGEIELDSDSQRQESTGEPQNPQGLFLDGMIPDGLWRGERTCQGFPLFVTRISKSEPKGQGVISTRQSPALFL